MRFTEDGRLTAASRSALTESNPQLADKIDAAEPFTDPTSGTPLVFSQLPLDRLRSIQDFDVKLALEGIEGVSEVASIGGYVRQYQIDVDPEALRAFDISLSRLVAAVNSANLDVGAKVIEENGMEILIRGVGFLGGEQRSAAERSDRETAVIRDIESIVVHADNGTPRLPPSGRNGQRRPGFPPWRLGQDGRRDRRGLCHYALRRKPTHCHRARQGED